MPDVLDLFLTKNIAGTSLYAEVIHELSSDHHLVMMRASGNVEFMPEVPTLIIHPFDWNQYKLILDRITNMRLPLKTPNNINKAATHLTQIIHFAASESSSTRRSYQSNSMHRFPPNILQFCKQRNRLEHFTKGLDTGSTKRHTIVLAVNLSVHYQSLKKSKSISS